MTYPLITEYNISGLEVFFIYANDVTGGIFMNGFLFATWIVACMGLYFMQKRMNGDGDITLAFAVGSYTTLVFTFLLRLVTIPIGGVETPVLVGGYTMTVVVAACIISTAAFLFSND